MIYDLFAPWEKKAEWYLKAEAYADWLLEQIEKEEQK